MESGGIPHAEAAEIAIKTGRFAPKDISELSNSQRNKLAKDIGTHTEIKPLNIHNIKQGLKTEIITQPSMEGKALATADRMDLTRFDIEIDKSKLFFKDGRSLNNPSHFDRFRMDTTAKITPRRTIKEIRKIKPDEKLLKDDYNKNNYFNKFENKNKQYYKQPESDYNYKMYINKNINEIPYPYINNNDNLYNPIYNNINYKPIINNKYSPEYNNNNKNYSPIYYPKKDYTPKINYKPEGKYVPEEKYVSEVKYVPDYPNIYNPNYAPDVYKPNIINKNYVPYTSFDENTPVTLFKTDFNKRNQKQSSSSEKFGSRQKKHYVKDPIEFVLGK